MIGFIKVCFICNKDREKIIYFPNLNLKNMITGIELRSKKKRGLEKSPWIYLKNQLFFVRLVLYTLGLVVIVVKIFF